MKKINWEIFFGDSSSEEALCLFAAGYSTFKQFMKNCSYHKSRQKTIKFLQHKGYNKSRKGAQQALNLRGFAGYKQELCEYCPHN